MKDESFNFGDLVKVKRPSALADMFPDDSEDGFVVSATPNELCYVAKHWVDERWGGYIPDTFVTRINTSYLTACESIQSSEADREFFVQTYARFRQPQKGLSLPQRLGLESH